MSDTSAENHDDIVRGLLTFDELLTLSRLTNKTLKKVVMELGFRRSKFHGKYLFTSLQASLILDCVACENTEMEITQEEIALRLKRAKTPDEIDKIVKKIRLEKTKTMMNRVFKPQPSSDFLFGRRSKFFRQRI